MLLLLSNQSVPLPEGFTLSLTRTNPLYSDRGTFSVEVKLPADQEPLRTLLAATHHPQAPAATAVLPFTLQAPEAGLPAINGTATLTALTNNEAAFTLRAETIATANGLTTSDTLSGADVYIDEAVRYYTQPLLDLSAMTATSELFKWYHECPPHPSCYTVEASGTAASGTINAILASRGETPYVFRLFYGDSIDLGDGTKMPLHLRLPWLVEKIINACTGLTLQPLNNCLRFHPTHARLCVLNVSPTRYLGDILPHWTLADFLLQLRRLLGVIVSQDGTDIYLNYYHQPYRYAPAATRVTYTPEPSQADAVVLTPALPRSYEIEEADLDEESGLYNSEQTDPRRANVGYSFLTETQPVELVPADLKKTATTWANNRAPRLMLQAAMRATAETYINLGKGSSLQDNALSKLFRSADKYADHPVTDTVERYWVKNEALSDLELQQILEESSISLMDLPNQPFVNTHITQVTEQEITPAPGGDEVYYNPKGLPSVTVYAYKNPAEEFAKLYVRECDYVAPTLRHDAEAGQVDYELKMSPCRTEKHAASWYTSKLELNLKRNLNRLFSASYDTDSNYYLCDEVAAFYWLNTDQNDNREYYEEAYTSPDLMPIFETGGDYDVPSAPDAPDGLELFIA